LRIYTVKRFRYYVKMDQWFEIVLDLLDELYPTLDLRHAELKDIEKSIKEESDPLKRKRYLITDIHGRIFNAVPLLIVGTEVLFRLPMDPNTPGYEWWGPNDLNPEKYVSITLDEQNEERYIVAKPFLSMVGLELESQEDDEENSSEKPCTSEIINIEGDKFGRMVFEPINIYPYNTGGNQDLFYLYEEPTKLDLNRLPAEFADTVVELMDEIGIYNPNLNPVDEPKPETQDEQISQSREVKSPVIIRKKSKPLTPQLNSESDPQLEARPMLLNELPEEQLPISEQLDAQLLEAPEKPQTEPKQEEYPVAKPKIVLKIQPKSPKQSELNVNGGIAQVPLVNQETPVSSTLPPLSAHPLSTPPSSEPPSFASVQAPAVVENIESAKVADVATTVRDKTAAGDSSDKTAAVDSGDKTAVDSGDKAAAGDSEKTPLIATDVEVVNDTPVEAINHQTQTLEKQQIKEQKQEQQLEIEPTGTASKTVTNTENEDKMLAEPKKVDEGQVVDVEQHAPVTSVNIGLAHAAKNVEEKAEENKQGPTLEDFQGYQDPSAATLYTNEPEKEEIVLELTGELQDTIELREGLSDGPIPSERYLFYPTQVRGYEWLNDNSPHPIKIKERSFPTVEHYVQFMKFFSGLEKEQRTNRKVLQEAYDKIVSSSAKDARALVSNGGELRSKMVNYRDENWNRQKNKILYYGRIHKIFSHPNLRERLLRLKPFRIHHRVVSLPKNLPKKSWNTVLGGSVFYDPEENRWYGGVEKDVWEQIRDS
jgi:predicted NAD-dependent protein-ADP-ribosyltransferase YbiA (DUF1768 family)